METSPILSVHIRPLTLNDIPEVARMHLEGMPQGEGWNHTAWEWEVQHPFRHPRVAVINHDVVGVASFWDEGEALYLATLLVHVSYRRRGIGKRLVQEGILLARTLHLPRIRLHARRDNTIAHAFYRRLGFSRQDVPPIRYPDGTLGDLWERVLPMR